MEAILCQLKTKDRLALEDFKKRIEDIQYLDEWKLGSDLYLFTWLRGAKMNVANAEDSIRRSFTWRAENVISGTFDSVTEEFVKLFPVYTDTKTETGIPVHTLMAKHWDLRWIAEHGKTEAFRRYACTLTNRGENQWLRVNERTLLEKGVEVMYAPELVHFILNARDVRYLHVTHPIFIGEFVNLMKYLSGIFLGYAIDLIFVDVPMLFTTLFNMMKPFLNFAGRLSCYNCNQSKWKKALSEFCTVEDLGHGFCDKNDTPVEDLLPR